MKKRVLIALFIFSVFFISTFAIAEDNETNSSGEIEVSDATQDSGNAVDNAYSCLREAIDIRECDELSTEEQIFSLLAVGKCKKELLDESNNEECWPRQSCNIKTTSQAMFTIHKSGSQTDEIEDWLLDREIPTSDIVWYLQIESPEKTNCQIKYTGNKYTITIDSDKTLSSGAGTCLGLSESGYWLRVSPDCFEKEFEVTCEKQFITNLLFKKKTSSTIHVSQTTHSASAEGTTKEYVNSSCFSLASSGSCDYEATLWATYALETLGNENSGKTIPYLIAMSEENSEYLPESFLYSLTGDTDFRNKILSQQKTNSYWDESGDKFYDTAVALLPFQYETPVEKSNSQKWLLDIQGDNGCWRNSIKDTAFILYSLWPRTISGSSGSGVDTLDCEDSGYHCMASRDCQGELLDSYGCAGSYKCCDTPKEQKTCVEQGGEICASNEKCIGGTSLTDAADLQAGEICCYLGSCEIPSDDQTECESAGGNCRPSCFEDEEESYYSCDFSDSCCMPSSSPGGSYWWIWALSILIILLILGIIFRNKLRPYWNKIISKFRKSNSSGSGPSGRPGFPGSRPPPGFPGSSGRPSFRPPGQPRQPGQGTMPPPGFVQRFSRKITHPETQKRPQGPRPKTPSKTKSEIDDVLKKLKEIGK